MRSLETSEVPIPNKHTAYRLYVTSFNRVAPAARKNARGHLGQVLSVGVIAGQLN